MKEIVEFEEAGPITFQEWIGWVNYKLSSIIAQIEALKSDLDYWVEKEKETKLR